VDVGHGSLGRWERERERERGGDHALHAVPGWSGTLSQDGG
jgi:hypothetical protein